MLARNPRASSPTSTPRPSSPTPGDFEQAKADVLKLVEWSCVPDAPKPDVAKTRAIPQLVKTLERGPLMVAKRFCSTMTKKARSILPWPQLLAAIESLRQSS